MPDDQAHTAPTLFLLMAQYNGQTVVPLDQICRDFFGHLTVESSCARRSAATSLCRSCGSRPAKRPSGASISSISPLISINVARQH